MLFRSPGNTNAAATLTLRDASGQVVETKSFSLAAHGHSAQYINELFPNRPAGLQGSLGFESDQPLAAITLREVLNGRGEPMYTTLPVVNPANVNLQDAVFPHIAVGGGYTTQVVLLNPTANVASGTLVLRAQNGTPLTVDVGNSSASSIPYSIPANGTYQVVLDRAAGLDHRELTGRSLWVSGA